MFMSERYVSKAYFVPQYIIENLLEWCLQNYIKIYLKNMF